MKISRAASSIQPTLIRKIRDAAKPTSLDLGLGQPDLAIPESVRQQLAELFNSEQVYAPYSPNLGFWELRECIGARYGWPAEGVMLTCGVQQGLAVAFIGLLEAGDEVLVPDPGFPAYANLARLAGAKPVTYQLDADQDWRLDPQAFREALSARTRLVVFNSPSNPTGAVVGAVALAEVLGLLAERGIPWVSDEIYADFIYGEHQHISPGDISEYRDGGLRLSGVSKAFHMMGWRLGWVLGPPKTIDALKPLHQHLVTSAPTLAQRAAQIALEQDQATSKGTLKLFEERRATMLEGLARLEGVDFAVPAGAFYVFIEVDDALRRGRGSLTLAEDILRQTDIVTIPGIGFGAAGENHLRLAYTVDAPILKEALSRLECYFTQCLRM